MTRILLAVLTVAALLLPGRAFSAETVKLKYVTAIYDNGKGENFKHPEGVACNGKDTFVVADTGNSRLVLYKLENATVTPGAEIKIAQMPDPMKVQFNSKGDIFVLDSKTRRIVHVAETGDFVGYVEPKGVPSPEAFVPRSFALDDGDNIYILDIYSARVLVLDPRGQYVKSVPFPKDYGFFSDLTISRGKIFMVDSVESMVYVSKEDSSGFDPLRGSLKEFMNFPVSITVDSRGTIFLVDKHGSGICIVNPDGSFQERLLGLGWAEGFLNYPQQLCLNEKGEVVIADSNNNRVDIYESVE